MAQAKAADKVAINFTGKLADGTLIDSTYPDPEHSCDDGSCDHQHGPLELIIGEGEFYAPVEEALIGMKVGEKKTLVISPEDAFGEYNPELVFSVDRGELPDEITPEVGMELEVTGEDDDVYFVTIVEVTDDEVSMDSNHPLAGEELTYEFELVEIF